MSTNTKVNPARMEAIATMLFGRRAALTLMSNNPSLKEYSIKRLKELYETPKEKIGSPEFKVKALVADTESIADAFGFDRSNLKFVGGDNEVFKKVLDTMDAILSFVNVFPSDNMSDVKSGVGLVAKTIKQYLPDLKSIGKLLSMAPGVSKYSKILIGFGETLDKAIDVLNREGKDSIRESIAIIREGLKDLYKVDIEDINKQVDMAKEGLKDEEEEKPKAKSKKSKKDEAIVGDNFTVVDNNTSTNNKKKEDVTMPDPVIAFQQQPYQQFYQQFYQPQFMTEPPVEDFGYVPEFLNSDLQNTNANKGVPEFIAENTMEVPRVTVTDRIFQPITQPEGYIDPRIMEYPWVRDIQKTANDCGYYINPSIIPDGANNPVMIRIDTFGGQNNVFLPDKSFIVDLGVIIDGRYGIWNAIQSNGNMAFLEFCNEAYALNTERTIENHGRKEKVQVLNVTLLEKIFKYGFSNLGGSLAKGDILYGERMIITNRVIDLITMPTNGLSRDAKNLIKGGCIRAATILSQNPAIGRLRFKSVDPKTLSFVLTNENEPSMFLGPVTARQPIEVVFTPVTDEQGKYVPVNPKGGSDIKYSVTYNG